MFQLHLQNLQRFVRVKKECKHNLAYFRNICEAMNKLEQKKKTTIIHNWKISP